MSKHTPGPCKWWDEATERPAQYDLAQLLGKDGEHIFTMYGGAGEKALGNSTKGRANARLIAAAPEMLGLLRKTVDVLPCTDAHDLEPDLQDNIEALIAKIEEV